MPANTNRFNICLDTAGNYFVLESAFLDGINTTGVVSFYNKKSELLWTISCKNGSPTLYGFDEEYLAVKWIDRTSRTSHQDTPLNIYRFELLSKKGAIYI